MMRLHVRSTVLCVTLLLLSVSGRMFAQAPAPPAARLEFPAAAPESVGLSTAALEALDAVVQRFVERDDAVGCELMVIKNRKTVWHAAHGLRDKTTGAKMQPGDISCIRSQTKSIIGTAIQMLIDDGRLALDDPAAKHLPAFDNNTHRAITIRHLLEHRSGLPLSSLLAADHKALAGVQDVAALAGKAELEFAPGSAFNYSDDGADTLTGIIEKVSGMPATAFIEERILKPLGMHDTICELKKDDPHLPRINSPHAGSRGAWARFWSPTEDEPLFPYLLGSQSAYSTCADYARLLCLWADDGVAPNGTRLLSHEAVARGVTPASEMAYPDAFKGLATRYGQLWMLWTEPAAAANEEIHDDGANAKEKVIVFGHGGSDGTIAWMWLEQDLIVLYYTQSRGGMTAVSIGPEVDRLLIRGEDPNAAATAPGTAGIDHRPDFAGVYWNHDDERYWAISPGEDADKLTIELQGRTVTDLIAGDAADAWKFAVNPQVHVRFMRDGEGSVKSLAVGPSPDREEVFERLAADDSLPAVDAVVEKVMAAHGVNHIEGVIKRTGTIEMPALKSSGPYEVLLSRDSVRADFEVRSQKTRVLVTAEGAWTQAGDAKATKVDAALAEQMEWEDSTLAFGDWRTRAKDIAILKRLQRHDKPALLARITTHASHPVAIIVDEESGRVLEQHRVGSVPGLGAIGAVTLFEDFAAVDGLPGVMLPTRITTTYVTPILGTATVKFGSTTVATDAHAAELFAKPVP